VIGIDEVSRRKGQVYLTVVYDLERRVLLWVGDDRTEEAVEPFFTKEMGPRRCRTLQVLCMDMWATYAKLVREHAPNAKILFDRFHIVKHLNEAVDAVRRELWRQLRSKEKVEVKGTRWLLLKNPWNLTNDQKERLSTLVRWNSPLVRDWYIEGSLSTVLDLQAAVACRATPEQVDPLGDAFETGALQEIRADAAKPSRRHTSLDHDPAFERGCGRHEQQDQVNQSSLVWISHCRELHRGHLPLLRTSPTAGRALITLFGEEPCSGAWIGFHVRESQGHAKPRGTADQLRR